jgi:hypothetical protein
MLLMLLIALLLMVQFNGVVAAVVFAVWGGDVQVPNHCGAARGR